MTLRAYDPEKKIIIDNKWELVLCNDCPFIVIDDKVICIIDGIHSSIIDLFAWFFIFSIAAVIRIGSTNSFATLTPKTPEHFDVCHGEDDSEMAWQLVQGCPSGWSQAKICCPAGG